MKTFIYAYAYAHFDMHLAAFILLLFVFNIPMNRSTKSLFPLLLYVPSIELVQYM